MNLRLPTCFCFLLFAFSCTQYTEPSNGQDSPEILKGNISMELIDQSPHIRTPIGLAIDHRDQLYVLESHTHQPLSDYSGPAFDQIKKGIDQDLDGRPESWIIYADSIEDGMNIVIDSEEVLYLTEKDKVKSFQDLDGDGKSDVTRLLLDMGVPESVYDHAGILGITIGPDDWLYISRGNTGGQFWEITGTDGKVLNGYGDGGNVFRCRKDGTGLEEIATGFWNPFDLKFTWDGRLILIDNDPDSRGPNRLVEIVPGGDYGYQSLYGGSGIHPFLAWNGELPGTLPYAAAVGEAPCGLIDISQTHLSKEFQQGVLAAIWEENMIVHIPLQKNGSTVKGNPSIVLRGDSTFHPVAMAANSKGEIYLTDWVIRQYPNHGEGKLWRIRSADQMKKWEGPNGVVRFRFGDWGRDMDSADAILKELQSSDVFRNAAARSALRTRTYDEAVLQWIESSNSSVRLQALLAAKEIPLELNASLLQRLLVDEDEKVQKMALIYIATRSRADLLTEVHSLLKKGSVTPALLETYLATIRHLQPAFIAGYIGKLERTSKQLKRSLPEGYLWNIIKDNSIPEALRTAALPFLEVEDDNIEMLINLFDQSSLQMKSNLLQLFRPIDREDLANAILRSAMGPSPAAGFISQALTVLQYQSTDLCSEVTSFLQREDPIVRKAAARYLCRCSKNEITSQAFKDLKEQDEAKQIWLAGTGQLKVIPVDEWAKIPDTLGSASNGRLVFQSTIAQCQICHKAEGWGGDFGPELSNVGNSKTKRQLITAILQPSLEIAPEWQGWFVTTKEGRTYTGRQIDVGFKNVELYLQSGNFETFEAPKDYGLASNSLMPDGLVNRLSVSDFNDLIAFLMTLK